MSFFHPSICYGIECLWLQIFALTQPTDWEYSLSISTHRYFNVFSLLFAIPTLLKISCIRYSTLHSRFLNWQPCSPIKQSAKSSFIAWYHQQKNKLDQFHKLWRLSRVVDGLEWCSRNFHSFGLLKIKSFKKTLEWTNYLLKC